MRTIQEVVNRLRAEYLEMPGLRLKLWPIYKVTTFPWVQIPPGAIGVVIAQVGAPLDPGAKSAKYHPAIGDFSRLAHYLPEFLELTGLLFGKYQPTQ